MSIEVFEELSQQIGYSVTRGVQTPRVIRRSNYYNVRSFYIFIVIISFIMILNCNI